MGSRNLALKLSGTEKRSESKAEKVPSNSGYSGLGPDKFVLRWFTGIREFPCNNPALVLSCLHTCRCLLPANRFPSFVFRNAYPGSSFFGPILLILWHVVHRRFLLLAGWEGGRVVCLAFEPLQPTRYHMTRIPHPDDVGLPSDANTTATFLVVHRGLEPLHLLSSILPGAP